MEASSAFPTVGIGASAGGLEAIEGLFRGMPADPGCAFVIVTHLNRKRRSLLHEIVERFTPMPVHVAVDGAVVQPNHVYVLPADATLGINKGRLTVSSFGEGQQERKPIDVFFSALAKDQGECSVGIVLSGGDADGALGVKAIKERGGLTMAQVADGTAPQHPDMPESAIATGLVDLAIPVEEMGQRLAEFARSIQMLDSLAATDTEAKGEQALEAARQEICDLLRNQLGHDFRGYKVKTFLRRVQRRMTVNHLMSLESYLEKLRQDPAEVSALFRDLLINVTNFFRDADAFDALAKLTIPALFEGRGAEDTVRVWVPGCATGEEVFSIAMLMREHMETLVAVPRVQIFATDIDEPSLRVARAARYPESLLDSVSEARRKRFFIKEGGSYLVAKEVRDLCVFSPHSVLRDPPFSRLDLVSCRNLLIYFGADAQNQVIPTFHYALRPGGFLFLGTSENVSQFTDIFTPLDKKSRLFRKRADSLSQVRLPLSVSGLRPAPFATDERRRRMSGLGSLTLRDTVDAQVVERFSPAHVVVNRDGDIVYFSGRTGKYLEASAGVPNRQILTMARKGLRLELRALLREAIETEQRVIRRAVSIDIEDDRVQVVDLTVEPMTDRGADGPLYLVVFSDTGPLLSREQASALAQSPVESQAHLERELRETRERLQSLIEEYETALEELKSSNEELVSVNEELQSTNEELEASKEELQSLNEELHTVNAELTIKVDALDAAKTDLQNLFDSTRIATLFLDEALVIRSFTPAIAKILNILPSDRGRPLTDLSSAMQLPDLAEDIRSVINDDATVERSVENDGNAHYLVRVAPYKSSDHTTRGAVLTFVDITSLTRAEEQQRTLIAELNHRVKNLLSIIIGVAQQTFKANPDPNAFKDVFIGRLHAMARSHELLSREHWTEASICELIRLELEPFGLERAKLSGPDLRLKPKQALSLGMVMHELTTNAGKYGALSKVEGRVDVHWDTVEARGGRQLKMTWREMDGPQISNPDRLGFGLKLVERETRYNLLGRAKIDFVPSGLVVDLKFPLAEDG